MIAPLWVWVALAGVVLSAILGLVWCWKVGTRSLREANERRAKFHHVDKLAKERINAEQARRAS